MLTGLKLGNFKAFGDTQNIPIKPLTLIYGANSAGKSSIIHGLLLACHSVKTGNLDVYQTLLGGDTVSLGGFDRYVHRRDFERRTTLGLELTADGDNSFTPDNLVAMKCFSIDLLFGILDYSSGYRQGLKPNLIDCNITIDNELVMNTGIRQSGKMRLKAFNCLHPFVIDIVSKTIDRLYNPTEEIVHINSVIDFFIEQGLFYSNRLLSDDFILDNSEERYKIRKETPNTALIQDITKDWVAVTFKKVITAIVESTSRFTSNQLQSVSYLGPMRLYPPRQITSNQYDSNWSAEGGYAWNEVTKNEKVRESVNNWLGSKHLQTKYEMSVRTYTANDSASDYLEELVLRDKRFNTVVSHRDVGFGISQVLPVLVSAFASENRTIAIEQPEIHLHPALQAELGDVFIQSALGENRNTFLLETHSEHLLLRIMRRMRDTANGTLPEGMPPVRPEDVAVLFVQPKQDNDNPTSVVTELRLDEDGSLVDEWPGGFFEEGFEERFA